MVCGDKVIALTFDDGPDRRDTPVALAALRAHRARATFFMMGTRAARNPAIVRQMHADGHQLGNHTWDHINAATQSSVDFKTSVVRTNTRIMSILQGTSRTAPSMRYPLAFRYPWGSGDARTEAVLRSLGMRSSGWTYATGDGGSHGPLSPYVTNLIATKVIDNAAPNAVILMHDGRDRPNTVAALPRILDTLSARGYVFVTVEDMRRLR
jgi:peptidoglycan/xylan/chitin deacetylase (PgdA/CDA1 family)